jgi:hypothetical protein
MAVKANRSLRTSARVLALWLLLALPAAGWAQAPGAAPPGGQVSEDVLSGFDAPLPGQESPPAGQAPADTPDFGQGFQPVGDGGGEAPQEGPSWWELGGFVRLDGSYNYAHDPPPPMGTDYRGLSKLRLALRLELPLRLGERWDAFVSGQAFHDFAYSIQGREHYPPAVLDVHEQEAEIREAWLRGTPAARLDVKLGRQIVVWGKSDNIRVVDVLNPLDFREPGLTDLEDLRLPLNMSRLDYYFGDWGVSAIAIHEVRFDKNPAPGSDFLAIPASLLPPEAIPAHGGRNTEYAMSLGGIFSGWELAFYWAQVFEDQAHFADVDPGPGVVIRQEHARTTMGGLAANVALGNFLLKAEAARFSGLEYFNTPRRSYVRGDGLLGLEYSGISDTTLSLEAAVRHLFGFDEVLRRFPDLQEQNVNQYVLAYRGSYLREKLDLVAVLSYFGASANEGSIQRYSATYEVARAMDLTGGVAIYTPGEGGNPRLVQAQDNDRAFFELKWSY